VKSIRGRLLARLIPAWLALLVLGVLSLEFGVERFLEAELDDALVDKARTLATLVLDRGDKVEFEFADELMPEFSRSKSPEYFEIDFDDGKILERSRSLHDAAFPATPGDRAAVSRWNLELPDGRPGRAVAIRASAHYEPLVENGFEDETRRSPRMIVRVARSRAELERMVTRMQWGLEAVMLALSVAVTFTVTRAVRRGLEPLDRLGAAVAAIDDRAPKLEIPDSALPRELQPIRERLEDLLARLGAALDRERRFTSSAAHELCTPIAELRTMSEVALQWPEDADQGRKRLRDTLAIAEQMEMIVTILLAEARAESDRVPAVREHVDVRAVLEQILREHAATIASKGLQVTRDLDADLGIETDGTRLQGILRNLVANAVEYAPPRGELRIAAHASGSQARIVVSNTDFTLTRDDVERLSEPFWRKDPARNDRAHVGLGLALAAAYARGISAELRFELEANVLLAALTLPSGASVGSEAAHQG
jgi:signal transduction histidine kinase